MYVRKRNLLMCHFLSPSVPDTPPRDISADLTSPYHILVTWDTPTHPSGVITGYTLNIQYERNGDTTPIVLGPNERSYDVTDLKPYQTIFVTITASTIVGEGVASGYLSYTTMQTGEWACVRSEGV